MANLLTAMIENDVTASFVSYEPASFQQIEKVLFSVLNSLVDLSENQSDGSSLSRGLRTSQLGRGSLCFVIAFNQLIKTY